MKFNLKLQKNLILIIALVTVIIAGGIFGWLNKKNQEIAWKKTFVDSKYYEVKYTPEGKIVENRKEGLVVKVPEGWIIKKYGDAIDLLNPDVEFDEYGGVPLKNARKGVCGMGVQIMKCIKTDPEIETYAEYIKNTITSVQKKQEGVDENEQTKMEVINIDNALALKTTHLRNREIRLMEVEVPINQTVYYFTSGFIMAQKCSEQFNKILETVSIEK